MVTGKPVTGKITGYRFQFSIIGYRFTDIFSARNAIFGFSFVLRTSTGEQRQAYTGPRHTGAIDGSVPLVQVYPVFDCRVCSSPLPRRVTAAGKGGEGRGANWTAGVDDTDLVLE